MDIIISILDNHLKTAAATLLLLSEETAVEKMQEAVEKLKGEMVRLRTEDLGEGAEKLSIALAMQVLESYINKGEKA